MECKLYDNEADENNLKKAIFSLIMLKNFENYIGNLYIILYKLN